MLKKSKQIIVGFSGGVDSAMTIKILQEKGLEPVVVFLKMFPDKNLIKIQDLADKLGVKLIVKDISNIFKDCIIKGFLAEYQNNRTPNPCVKCNLEVKFKNLLEIADELGIEKVATGHYAQIQEAEGKFKLMVGLDETKDQSYFLYRLTQKELARIIFPLGDKQKEKVKKEALENKLFEEIKESQDICFLDKAQKVQDFLKENLKVAENQQGKIEDEQGNYLGQHQGLVYYTQGQRKGLDLAGGPFYVVGKNLEKNILVVSKDKNHPALVNKEISIGEVSWVDQEPQENKKYLFKSRYRAKPTLGKIKKEEDNWKIILDVPQWAVAKGQSTVIYEGGEVLGGGTIK